MAAKVCVIGSNSFSGATFCKHLLQKDYEVIGISRSEELNPVFLPYKWGNSRRFQFHQYDLNHHLEQILTLLDSHKIGTIYNFAAQSMVSQSWDVPEHWFQTNTLSTIKFHNQLRSKDYLDRYIHISTPEVYGSCSGSVTENNHYRPSTPYAVSRAAADMSLHSFFDAYQFPVLFTRAANVYGEGQQLYRIIPKAIFSILTKQILPLHGGGHSERSFIHMDDVAAATHAIGEQGNLGDVYHISNNELLSIRQLIEKICDMMSYPFESLCEISEERLGKDKFYSLNSDKLRHSLHWKDEVTLENGIERTIAWVNQNLETLINMPNEYIHKA